MDEERIREIVREEILRVWPKQPEPKKPNKDEPKYYTTSREPVQKIKVECTVCHREFELYPSQVLGKYFRCNDCCMRGGL